MTVTFAAKSEDSNVGADYIKLMQVLESAIISPGHNWDLRTVYSALIGLTEIYREALRSTIVDMDKDQFDAFLDAMDVFITSHVSHGARPKFEAIMSGKK